MRIRLFSLAIGASLCLSALPFVPAIAAVQVQPSVSSSAAVSGSAVVAEAEKFLGYPYSYTGSSPATGFSCIGFVWYVYQQLGQTIPGNLSSAMAAYPQEPESALQPGDIIFFQNTWWAGVSHVAIYIGGNKFIDAENPQRGVRISTLSPNGPDGTYWQDHYLTAERPWTGAAGRTPNTPAGNPSHTLYVVVPNLNLRAGASMGDAVLTVLTQGDSLHIEGWAPGWVRVRDAGGTLGWVMRGGVSKTQGSTPPPQNTSGSKPSGHKFSIARRRAAWHAGKTIYVNGVNVHSSPSLSASVLETVPQGGRVGILHRISGWDHVLLKDSTVGWADAQFVGHGAAPAPVAKRVHNFKPGRTPLASGINVHSAPSLSASVVATSDGNPIHIVKWTAAWVRARLSDGTVGWIYRSLVGGRSVNSGRGGNGAASSGSFAVDAGVNIHAGPALSARVINTTSSGMTVAILGTSGGFTHIHTSTGITGWVASRFIRGAAGSAGGGSSSGTSGMHATASIRLHGGPGINRPVIGMVRAGARVTVVRSLRGWDRVRLRNGRVGWVDAAYLAG